MKRVFLSHPRGGSTWFNRLLKADVKRRGRFMFSHEGIRIAGDGVVQRPKSHDFGKYAGDRVVTMIRDPRDVAISLYHFCRYRCHNESIDMRKFCVRETRLTTDYYEAIRVASGSFACHAFVRYEDCLVSPDQELVVACFALDLTVGDPVHAVAKHTFEKMQARDKRRKQDKPDMSWEYTGDDRELQVRSGKAGSWADHFADGELPGVPGWILRSRYGKEM